jgi:hypothetical protein
VFHWFHCHASSYCHAVKRIAAVEVCVGGIICINTPLVRWSALGLGKFLWWKEKITTPHCIICFVYEREMMD